MATTYRKARFTARCIECSELASSECARCGGGLCAQHTHATGSRCQACELDFELHKPEREPFTSLSSSRDKLFGATTSVVMVALLWILLAVPMAIVATSTSSAWPMLALLGASPVAAIVGFKSSKRLLGGRTREQFLLEAKGGSSTVEDD